MTLMQAAQGSGFAGSLLTLVIMFAVFYFLLIRPQQLQQKKRKEMLDGLKKGDKVITVGGIHGEITAIQDDELMVRVADKVELRMSRGSISRVKGKE